MNNLPIVLELIVILGAAVVIGWEARNLRREQRFDARLKALFDEVMEAEKFPHGKTEPNLQQPTPEDLRDLADVTEPIRRLQDKDFNPVWELARRIAHRRRHTH